MEKFGISKKYFFLLTGLFLLAVFLLALKPIADYDTGYHLKTGEYIVTHLTVPHSDIFSYTAPGANWIVHYWLADVIFYLIYVWLGSTGLIVFVALVATLTFFIVLATVRRRTNRSLIPLILLLVFAYLTLELWVARPQIFSYLFVALLIYVLERWRQSENNRWLFAVPVIFLIWANMHAGVILGILVLGLYCIVRIVSRTITARAVLIPTAAFVVSTVATLINPNGINLLLYGSIIAPAVNQMQVGEWMSLISFFYEWQAKVFIGLMVASVAFVCWNVWREKKPFLERDWVEFGLISGVAIMPFISIRHVAFFPIIALPIFVYYLEQFFNGRGITFGKIRFVLPLTILLGLILVAGPIIRLPRMQQVSAGTLPVGGVEFIKEHQLPGNVFNVQHFGGYLIWQLWPQYKVFMDGRSEVFEGKPNDNYGVIFYHYPGWKQLVDSYNINTVIYSWPDVNRYSSFLGSKLFSEWEGAGFVLVYFDDLSLVFVRNVSSTQPFIEKYGYGILSPYTDVFTIPAGKLLAALHEAQRAYATGNGSYISYLFGRGIQLLLDNATSTSVK